MAAAQEQDFLRLMKENQGIVYKICHMYAKTDVAKQDLFQEITIQLWRAFPTFRGGARFSTWMYRVALNTAITSFRKSKKQRSEVKLTPQITGNLQYEDYDDETEQRLKLLYKAIETLNPIEKALVFLYLEDRPYKDIAQTLGIAEVNARVKMNRVKEKLRKLLKHTS